MKQLFLIPIIFLMLYGCGGAVKFFNADETPSPLPYEGYEGPPAGPIYEKALKEGPPEKYDLTESDAPPTPPTPSGSAALLSGGTDTTQRKWSAKELADEFGGVAATQLDGLTDVSGNGTQYFVCMDNGDGTFTFQKIDENSLDVSANIASTLGAANYAAAVALWEAALEAALADMNITNAAQIQDLGANVGTWLVTPSVANLAAALSDDGAYFATMAGWADAAAGKAALSIDDLITLSGVADGAQNLGAFTGTTIADNQTLKAAIQALETAVEAAGGHLEANIAPVDTGDEDATFYPVLVDGATGSQATETDGELYYNPSTGRLAVPIVTAGEYESSAADGSRISYLPENSNGNEPTPTAGDSGFYFYDGVLKIFEDYASAADVYTLSKLIPDDTAYNESSWDSNTDGPTKNAVRDEMENKQDTISFGTGAEAALGNAPSAAGGFPLVIASGTASLGTSEIASGACATVVSETATGAATTDIINWDFNSDPTSTTGYNPSTGVLTIFAYPTSNNANFKVCNLTDSAITPGAVTLNWMVIDR